MKKVLSVFISICTIIVALTIWFNAVATENTTEFAGGDGSVGNPYKISTTAHLNNVRNYLDAHFVLINDIVFTTDDYSAGGLFYSLGHFLPIGDSNNQFAGVFDGNHFIIENMKIDSVSDAAMFYQVGSGAVIKNLGIISGEIRATDGASGYASSPPSAIHLASSRAAAFAIINKGTIENCFSNTEIIASATASADKGMGSPRAYSYASGIVVDNYGTIKNCYNRSIIKSNSHAWRWYTVTTVAQASSCGITSSMVGADSVIENCYTITQGDTYAVTGRADDYYGYTYLEGINEPISGNSAGTVSNCYYLNTLTSASRGIALSNEQMQQSSNFTGFDFDTVWTMNDNTDYPYPELRCPESAPEFGVASVENQQPASIGKTALIAVTVKGSASKIRFVDSKSVSTTFARDNTQVNSITDNGDGTETWLVSLLVLNDEEDYTIYAKHVDTGWSENVTEFTLTAKALNLSTDILSIEFEKSLDGVIYYGVNEMKIVTADGIEKIQFIKNGNTCTYSENNAEYKDENGQRTWTIKMNFCELGDHTYDVRVRTAKTTFEVVDSLTVTVYSK